MKTKRVAFVTALCFFIFLSTGITLGGSSAHAALIFSEYVEGSSFNKALEIFNCGPGSVDLVNCSVQIFANGSSSSTFTYALSNMTLQPGNVFVLAHSSASATLLAAADQTVALNFNGDDAITLVNNGTVDDSIGQVGFDPGSEWGSGLTSTQDNTLRRSVLISVGDTVTNDSFDPSLEWDGFAQDTFDGLGAHPDGPILLSVPTLSEWGMIILFALLVGSGLWVMKRKKQKLV